MENGQFCTPADRALGKLIRFFSEIQKIGKYTRRNKIRSEFVAQCCYAMLAVLVPVVAGFFCLIRTFENGLGSEANKFTYAVPITNLSYVNNYYENNFKKHISTIFFNKLKNL
jgi:hypothetical protein